MRRLESQIDRSDATTDAEFRRNARSLRKDHSYFEPFGCLDACDNVGLNLRTQFVRQTGCSEPEASE